MGQTVMVGQPMMMQDSATGQPMVVQYVFPSQPIMMQNPSGRTYVTQYIKFLSFSKQTLNFHT